MPIPANTRIKLGSSSPKKDAEVGQPGTPALGGEVAIWAAASVNPNKTQTIVGEFQELFDVAKSSMPAVAAVGTDPVIVWKELGDPLSAVRVGGSPTSDALRLEIGEDVATGQKSHFLNRTFKRLIERWLEESK